MTDVNNKDTYSERTKVCVRIRDQLFEKAEIDDIGDVGHRYRTLGYIGR